MQKILVASALVLAGLGAAGVATAGDDCASAPTPGFYNQACLFDDHAYFNAYSFCDWFGNCYSGFNASYTNRFASGQANSPISGTGVNAAQGTSAYSNTVCSLFGGCSSTSGNNAFTSIGAGTGTPIAGASAGFNQNKGSNSYNYGWASGTNTYENTNVGVGVGVPFFFAGTGFYQSTYNSGCSQGVYAYTNFFGLPIPGQPCSVSTPAGTQSTVLPQLWSTCQSTPAGVVCARFPDMPDGTGLPFL